MSKKELNTKEKNSYIYNPLSQLKDADEQTPAMPIDEVIRINDIMETFEKETSIGESKAELQAQTITIGGFKA